MKAVEIKKGIYWVGVKDWNLREFHGYSTSRGSTYNSYLIIDDKITLIDGVKAGFADQTLSKIRSVIDPSKIDVVVCNHVEMDHSGALPEIMKIAKNATVYCSLMGQKGLNAYFDTTGWKMNIVKTGDTLTIGKHTLSFLLAPMVHWPDSMMTYVTEEKTLFSNDCFGQHYAADTIFDNEKTDFVFDEAKKYYGNIVLPYGSQVQKVLAELDKFDIQTIAPSHGVIWNDHIPEIIKKYVEWSAYDCDEKRAVIVYDTMWGSTETMARTVASAWGEKGIKTTIFSLQHSELSDIVNQMMEVKYIAIGSPALNAGVLPTVGGFMTYIKGLGFKNKVGFCFGSYGWKKDVLEGIEQTLKSMGWELPEADMVINYRPTQETLAELTEKAKNVIG